MNSQIQLSVALPVYNGAKNLKKHFNRIFKECDRKKFKDFFEIIISDNCSTDNTREITYFYKKKFLKKKNLSIKYYSNKKNLGYFKNFIRLPKLATGKYIIFFSDDDIPEKGFYNKIYSKINNKNDNTMLIAPIRNSKRYFKTFFGINKVSYIVNRGSPLSGVLLLTKKAKKYKTYLKTLYPHTELYLDYFLKFNSNDLKIRPIIVNKDKQKLSEKLSDRMSRKQDLALLDKVKIIDKFYLKKRISFLEYFYSLYSIYKWGLSLKWRLRQEKKLDLENKFYLKIIKNDKKKILSFIIFLIFLRNFFSKKNNFYFEAFLIKFFN